MPYFWTSEPEIIYSQMESKIIIPHPDPLSNRQYDAWTSVCYTLEIFTDRIVEQLVIFCTINSN